MIFYVFFGFWELVFRTFLTIFLYGLYFTRLVFLCSLPIFVLVISTIIVAKIAFRLTNVKNDENRTVEEIVSTRGFRLETHRIVTPDGYVLILHRVINPFVNERERTSKPILLMHGLGMHSLIFLLNEEKGANFRRLIDPSDPFYNEAEVKEVEDSLGFELAKRGFDVWLGNQRGNRFCQTHTSLSAKDAKFWDFSLDEIASYDLPTTIEYILSTTKQTRLSYVGQSQGSTIMFALLASIPRYNDIVKPFIAMAPVVKTTHSPFVRGFGSFIQSWAPTYAYWFPGSAYPSFFEFCVQLFFCNHSLESLTNTIGKSLYAGKYINQQRVSAFLAYPGVHASRKNAFHYLQFAKNDFTKFDYGSRGNKKIYGSSKAPKYNLSSITNDSIAIIYSLDDTMAAAQDVRFLRSQLTVSPIDVYVIKKKKFNHQDFQLSKGCGSIVNSRILLILNVVLTSRSSTPKSDQSMSNEVYTSFSCPSSSNFESAVDKVEDGNQSPTTSTSSASSNFEMIDNIDASKDETFLLRRRK